MLLGSAYGKIDLDASGAKAGVGQAIGSLQNLQKTAFQVGADLKRLGSTLTIGLTLPIVAMGGASIKAASSLNEAKNKVQVVFGEMSDAVMDWSKDSADAFGQSQRMALESAGTFGNFFTAMGIGVKESSNMSMSLTQLASDLASFNDMDPAEALLKLQAGLAGEAEPMRRLGVDLTMLTVKAKAAEMGLADANGEFSQQALVLARYAVIMEKTATAQGDFARTAHDTANLTRSATAQFENLRAEFGDNLLPIVNKVLEAGIKLMKLFQNLPEPVQNLIIAGAAMLAALGPLLGLLGNLVIFIANVGPALSALGVGLPALGAAFTTIGTVITGTVVPALGALAVTIGTVILPILLIIGTLYLLYMAFKTNFGGIRTTAEQLWFILKWGFGQLWSQLSTAASSGLNGLSNKFKTWRADVQDTFSQAVTGLERIWKGIWLIIEGRTALGLANIRLGWLHMVEWFGQIRNRILDAFNIDWSVIGRTITQGIIAGLLGGNAGVAAAVMTIGKTILDTFKKALDARSPSRKAMYYGSMTTQGFLEGMAAAMSAGKIASLLTKPVQQVAGSSSFVVQQHFATGLTTREARRMVDDNNETMVRALESALGGR